jgi:hypothetical protein
VAFRIPNPIGALSRAMNRAFDSALRTDEDDDGASAAPVPVQPSPPAPAADAQAAQDDGTGQETTIVTGRFIPDGQPPQDARALYSDSIRQTERFRRLVEKFDEDRQEPLEWAIRKLASLFCYLAPFTLAVPIGLAVGDAFTRPGMTFMMGFAVHLVSVFLEVIMPVLALATVIALKRAMKDRSQTPGTMVVLLFFFVVSLANGFALLFLIERGVNLGGNPAVTVGTLGRSFGPFIIDLGAMVYLSVSNLRSLKKYLDEQRRKIQAIREANDVHIQLEQTQIKAAIDRQTAIMDMQSKQQRAQTWNEIEKMQSQSMIEQARRNLEGGRDGLRRGGW